MVNRNSTENPMQIEVNARREREGEKNRRVESLQHSSSTQCNVKSLLCIQKVHTYTMEKVGGGKGVFGFASLPCSNGLTGVHITM